MEKHIQLPLTEELAKTLHAGDTVYLTGTIYTSRDAGHKRMCEALARGEKIPFDPTDATIYYVGPTPAKPGQVIGSAGPTTSGRMDAYAPTMMSVGARGMIGKGARLPEVVEAMKKYHGVYFGAIGGAGALLAKCIKKAELISILEKEGVTAGEVPEIPCALYLSGYDHLSALPSFCEGLYQVQDLSSMQVALWSEVKAGDQVLDVCAAPGGKAIHIAELLNGTGHVEARDLTEYKVALIRDNIERSGLTNINAVCQDAAIYDPHKKETADIVIADLPCSGLGVLGKKPDLRYKMNEKTEADLVELQKKILSVVKDYVKPGGKLLYSTCTIHREENEGNVEWFLKEYPEFELVKEKQMIPGRDAGDGFYIAIIKRVNHE